MKFLFLLFVLARNSFTKEELDERHKAAEWILGPLDELTASAPTIDPTTGNQVGGTQAERSARFTPVAANTRAYSTSFTHQHARMMNGPEKGLKFAEDDSDGHIEGRRHYLKVCHVFLLAFFFLIDHRWLHIPATRP
jgi:hypothetical protein